jgi:hypothetical protein
MEDAVNNSLPLNVVTFFIPEFTSKSSLNKEEYLILENEVGLIEDAINQYF